MNLLKHAQRMMKSIPPEYGVTEYSDFSGSISYLNDNGYPYSDYSAYLASGKWAIRRELYIEHFNGICQKCLKRGIGLTLHHQSYQRLGKENLTGDLILVCRKCHFKIHLQQEQG